MYNWIIAKYGTPNANWTNSQFDIVGDDVYTTFFHEAEPAKDVEDVVKPDVQDVAKTNVEADQDVLECSEKRCPRVFKKEEKEDQQDVVATNIVET
nr:hypothetical protein [Tanacetum cinerariifolium]